MLTDEQKKYILANYKGCGPKEMAERIGATKYEVKGFYGRKKLHSGLDGRFRKGHESPNKGKKREEFMTPEQIQVVKRTEFKKGHVPHNTAAVGTLVKRHDGYLQRKTGEDKWELEHRLVWEKANGRKLKPGELVEFIDGNRENLSPDNLMLISKVEHCYISRNRLKVLIKDNESAEVVRAISRLRVACYRRMKNAGKPTESC